MILSGSALNLMKGDNDVTIMIVRSIGKSDKVPESLRIPQAGH